MLTIFNRAELLITFDAALYGRCTDALVAAGIPYRVRTQYTGHANRRSGMWAAVGENPDCSVSYRVYVARKDLEWAKHVCRRAWN